MRKIVASFFISLDGVVEAPDQWHFPYFNDEMGAAIGALAADADAMLMGRVMYDEWSEFWPKQPADEEFAGFINNVRKYVVSTTLDKADWNNSTLVKGDLVEEITKIKQEPGLNINMSGSTNLVRSLLRHGLIDELHLLVHPIAVGTGQRLFEDGVQIPLKLVSSTTFKTGVLHLAYEVAAK
ncbi:pyrimidine reductase [Sphaerisporangium krabiense]|uniref:Dihydrofolate reductase n=1 Tax=Sphaerisporangium krabiense TaxID=763782 RepID=A0A7W8Z3D6_9ACTN|nr:dihydrofolate reductase family protein [Sphaerisporangium krabiense]MBB5626490.1 dihydrofolate reductase [Sphaerisporangium krabiense]GII63412.1 pyrimidine reductase [Sphaerisporangium krabiense]